MLGKLILPTFPRANGFPIYLSVLFRRFAHLLSIYVCLFKYRCVSPIGKSRETNLTPVRFILGNRLHTGAAVVFYHSLEGLSHTGGRWRYPLGAESGVYVDHTSLETWSIRRFCVESSVVAYFDSSLISRRKFHVKRAYPHETFHVNSTFYLR